MSGRHYDPDALEELGRVACAELSEDYEYVVERAYVAGLDRDSAFHETLAGDWDSFYTIFYNCLYETAANIQAFGGALLAIVDRGLDDEDAIAAEIQDAQEQVMGGDYTPVEEYADTDDTPELAPDPDTLDDNPYEDQLSGHEHDDPEMT